ncbi:GntR family transcriptional regulator [Billgrantia desiderata]|uniref:GntR family transcriptional regulator n=1 Tax=Billgrantia desiderata TaxID=52021 RepID=UPI00089E2D5F|nr:GntR family transcriptional regulator [Halomonas desiderata]SEG11646.1 transcriptional regulator, GntR family [Halomonas desiderata]
MANTQHSEHYVPAAPPAAPPSVEDIVAAIEEDIVLGRLNPKERLVEEDLLERFGGKRHVVRQALFQLEDIGLVERIKNRGAFVKVYTPQEVEDLYAMRELLELAAIDALPLPAPEALMERLEEIQVQHSQAVGKQDMRSIFRLNIAFHQVLFAATGNRYLTETINDFAKKAHAIRFAAISDFESLKRARDEHIAIIEAIKQQDRQALRELCRQHILPSKESYIRMYQLRVGEV